jgi:glutaminyl-peptide cyclotransferase
LFGLESSIPIFLETHIDFLNNVVLLFNGGCVLFDPNNIFISSQGLTYANGVLYESTGLYGKSTVRILDPNTADVVKSVSIPGQVFGEGMTYYDTDKLIQVTWKSRRGFIYNATNLDKIQEFSFTTTKNEGWGITLDGCRNELIVSDGSDHLHFWDPATLVQKRTVAVKRQSGVPAREMNEIEFYRGRVLANVWYEDVLLVIHPVTGVVEKEYGTFSIALIFAFGVRIEM